jgi:endonuclease YncB( thermonuclease family)
LKTFWLESNADRRSLQTFLSGATALLVFPPLARGGLARDQQSGSGGGDSTPPQQVVATLSDPSFPQPDWSLLERGEAVRITGVVDGDTVELESGPDVRFVGTQAPKLPLGRAHVEEWPLARRAKDVLESLIFPAGHDDQPRAAQLFYGGRRTDRHGRRLAHLVLDDGADGSVWLQGAMVLAGFARVYTFADNRSLIPDLLQREQHARSAQRGIWSHSFYDVRQADDPELPELINHFELVEGTVLNVAAHRARWYLNFGETWREDFTITIDREHDPVFEDSGFDLNQLAGADIRVRGWIVEDGGPMVRVDHPEAIEVLSNAR